MIAKGQKISDRYEVIKSIGEGGMANVYLAYDTILERNVAIKVLRGDLSSDEKFVRRFQREALQASSLTDKNIVEVYDVGEDDGNYYIVMEYVEGKHLKNLLKKRGKLTVSEVIDIMLQVTSGLSLAHDQYIIHRDIKPQNIMILENGLVKLTDFGIAVALNSTQLTQTNSVMGSVHYLPPEGASGKGATLQSDIYSLGILMYELLTGKLPFRGENAVEIALKHLKEKMPSIKNELPDIPQSIDNIITRATAKNPKNRYVDAREMYEDLKTSLEESRFNEEKIKFEYPETDFDDNKTVKVKEEKTKTKTIKKDEEEVVAKKITQKELKKQNKALVVLMSIFTGIVVIIASIFVLLPYLSKSAQITVPDVTDMTIANAIKTLQDEGFKVLDKQIEQSSSKVEEGHVIKTSPGANTNHKKGYEITLYVSTGNKEIVIEDYKGQNYSYIKGLLEGKGLNVFVTEVDLDEDDENVEAGCIISQSVEPEAVLTSGDEIKFEIPTTASFYPDFTDGTYKVSDIFEYCEEHSIKCVFKDSEGNNLGIQASDSNEYDDYQITKQVRKPGSKVAKSATQTITIDVKTDTEPNGLD